MSPRTPPRLLAAPAALLLLVTLGACGGDGGDGETAADAAPAAPTEPTCPTTSSVTGTDLAALPTAIDPAATALARWNVNGLLEVGLSDAAIATPKDAFKRFDPPPVTGGERLVILRFEAKEGAIGEGSYGPPGSDPEMEILIVEEHEPGKGSRTNYGPREGSAEIIRLDDEMVCGTFSMRGPVNAIEGQFAAPFIAESEPRP